MTTITTDPDSASLFLNGQPIGKSPCTVRVQDGLLAPKYIIRAELKGYKTVLLNLDQRIKPALAVGGACCGILFLPGLGLLLYATEHESQYNIILQREEIMQPSNSKPG